MLVSYLGAPVWKKDEVEKTPKNLIPNFRIKDYISIDSLFDRIKNDKDLLRFTEDVRAGKRVKQEAEGYIAAGEFSYRANDPKNLKQLSGILLIDIDKFKIKEINALEEKGQSLPLNALPEFEGLIERLKAWPFTYAVHKSFTPGNLSLYIKIPPIRERYEDYFRAVNNELFNKFAVVADPSARNPAFAKRINGDPDIFINKKAKEWTKIPKPAPVALRAFHPEISDDNFQHCLDQIKRLQIDICPDYDDWVQVMLAIAEEYNEQGLEAFLMISNTHENLKENERSLTSKYKNACKVTASKSGKKSTIKTFYYFCKKAGLEIVSDKTFEIRKACLKQFSNPYLSVTKKRDKVLKDLERKHIEIPQKKEERIRFDGLLSSYLSMTPDKFGELVTTNNKQRDVENYISSFSPCRNSLNGELLINGTYVHEDQLYLGGEPLLETMTNSLVSDCNILFDMVGADKLVKTYLKSSKIPEIHPVKSFIERKKQEVNEVTTGHIDNVVDSITINTSNAEKSKFLKSLLRKWILSLGQWKYYEKVVMIPVLTGAGNINKSRFFEHLLPEELRFAHYTKGNLEKSDNFNRFKADKLIINDDEFKCSSKKDVKTLKELTSENFFNHRPLYMERHLTLQRSPSYCGTSNEREILNDLTGNRRIVPIPVKWIDFEKFDAVDKAALFLEIEKENDEWVAEPGLERSYFMSRDEAAQLKEYSEESMNHDALYYLLEANLIQFPEGSKKGAVYADVFARCYQTSKLKFSKKEFTLTLEALGVRIDKRQTGQVYVGLAEDGRGKWVKTSNLSRKSIVRAEFFNELHLLNGKWKQE